MSGSLIHPTAIVDPSADIAHDVEIGPLCVIGPKVRIKERTRLISHISLVGTTEIGRECTIYPHVSIGHPPQDFKHKGGPVRTVIGDRCTLRESVNIHPGTDGGRGETSIGNDCYFMVGCHIAHDCIIGDHVVLTNAVQIGGMVELGNYVTLGGVAAVHQYTRIGEHAFVGGLSLVTKDVIPYGYALGNIARLVGLNVVGMKRRGLDRGDINDLRAAYRMLFAQEGTFKERLEYTAAHYSGHSRIYQIVDFIKNDASRHLCMP